VEIFAQSVTESTCTTSEVELSWVASQIIERHCSTSQNACFKVENFGPRAESVRQVFSERRVVVRQADTQISTYVQYIKVHGQFTIKKPVTHFAVIYK
jgi:hypothetical protein